MARKCRNRKKHRNIFINHSSIKDSKVQNARLKVKANYHSLNVDGKNPTTAYGNVSSVLEQYSTTYTVQHAPVHITHLPSTSCKATEVLLGHSSIDEEDIEAKIKSSKIVKPPVTQLSTPFISPNLPLSTPPPLSASPSVAPRFTYAIAQTVTTNMDSTPQTVNRPRPKNSLASFRFKKNVTNPQKKPNENPSDVQKTETANCNNTNSPVMTGSPRWFELPKGKDSNVNHNSQCLVRCEVRRGVQSKSGFVNSKINQKQEGRVEKLRGPDDMIYTNSTPTTSGIPSSKLTPGGVEVKFVSTPSGNGVPPNFRLTPGADVKLLNAGAITGDPNADKKTGSDVKYISLAQGPSGLSTKTFNPTEMKFLGFGSSYSNRVGAVVDVKSPNTVDGKYQSSNSGAGLDAKKTKSAHGSEAMGSVKSNCMLAPQRPVYNVLANKSATGEVNYKRQPGMSPQQSTSVGTSTGEYTSTSTSRLKANEKSSVSNEEDETVSDGKEDGTLVLVLLPDGGRKIVQIAPGVKEVPVNELVKVVFDGQCQVCLQSPSDKCKCSLKRSLEERNEPATPQNTSDRSKEEDKENQHDTAQGNNKKKFKIEEPECLVLSSDEDNSEDEDPYACPNNDTNFDNDRFEDRGEDGGLAEYIMENENVHNKTFTTLLCKQIRIGTFGFPPNERVLVSTDGIRINVPDDDSETGHLVITIENSDILKVLVHLGDKFIVIFLYLTPKAASKIRQLLQMSEEDDERYYNPKSGNELHRRITFILNKVTEDNKTALELIYKGTDLYSELSENAAKSILKKSTPRVRTPENQKLLIYPPPPERGAIALYIQDYACLADDTFLNDVIIDFYLKYLTCRLNSEKRNRVHVFSTFFLKRLKTKPKTLRADDPENDDRLTEAQKRHIRVKKWTKNINIFEKDFIIIPINEEMHWFLAIVCFPGLLVPETDDVGNIRQACILIFDSLLEFDHRETFEIIRDYLTVEYYEKMKQIRVFDENNIPGDIPKVPQQNNFTDCGTYLLQYVEVFLEEPMGFPDYKLPVKELQAWFGRETVARKRKHIASLILRLMIEQKVDITQLDLPVLFENEDSDMSFSEESMEEGEIRN